ncbi:cell division transpeptidase FtsI [Neokomagataea thailandica NBRC 106555]|nr:penicillin-binding protein 2 [Neokomagataea tanensis]GBR53595.1 cell division transpeptidase FtsI [Neokomagataea thailandica NBRC 106555]
MAVQAGVLGVLGRRLHTLQLHEGEHLRQLAERNRTSKRLLAPARGPIQDRFGRSVAENKVSWRALLIPEETTEVSAVIERFSTFISLDEHDHARIERDLKHMHKYVPVTLREFLSWDDMAKIELNAPSLPGVLVDVGSTRLYPYGELMSHVVGYVAPPNETDVAKDETLSLPGMRVGRAGLEQTQESLLRGSPGSVEMEVNAHGRVIGELNREDGQQGATVKLTLDAALQEQVRDRLGDRVASSVVMDCQNGEVLAMVSTPSFNPSLFDSGVSHAQWNEWIEDPKTPLVDKAVSGLYPPGSTFKPAVAMAALKAGSVSPHDRFVCPGYFDMGGVRFHCWNKYGHGALDMREALKFSCDVYFYEVARRCGMDPIKDVGNYMGLGVPLGIELPHARAGIIPTPEWRNKHGFHWNGGDTVNAGIGQGFVQVTPLALATYVSRIASGRNVQPHLLRTTNDHLSSLSAADTVQMLDIPQEHLGVVRAGMFAVVNEQHGTAPKARLDLPGITMAGKTGSAQVRRVSRAMRESGHFNSADLPWEYRPHALFICFAPYDEPKYAVSVVVEHGNAGAEEAAPLAKQIMTDTLLRDPSNQTRPQGQTVARAESGQG